MLRIGIDLGGTKIEIAALDDAGRELVRRRVPTPDGYAATLDAMAALVQEAETALGGRASIGIGTPGALSAATGLIKNSNSTCLIGRPLQHDLGDRLKREVRLANDANCFALAEAVDGAARGADVVFGVILGTGVGGGIVVAQRVLVGPNAIAGEWGHNPLPAPTDVDLPPPGCYCGRAGCIEAYLSGPALADEFARETGRLLSAKRIAQAAVDGDDTAMAALARYKERLARSLAGVINILDPDVIVLGGGLSNIESLYADVPRLWGPHVFSDDVRTRLVRNAHGDAGGVRGAAWLWR